MINQILHLDSGVLAGWGRKRYNRSMRTKDDRWGAPSRRKYRNEGCNR